MKKLWRIFAVVTALCMMLTTVAFAAEAADDATTAEEPAATDEAAEGEEEPAADDTEEPVNTVVQPDDNLYPVALDDYNGLSQIPFMTRLFTQNHINWTLVQLGEPVEGVFGQTVEANWDNTKFLIEWKDTDTNNFTQDPLLVLQISDNGILQEPLTSGTVGELGETVLELQKELEEAEEEENQAEEPSADDEAPAADDAEEGAPATDSESGSSAVVIVIVVVVVVIAIIAVVVVLGKKKKA